jgi:hypothetical protein
MAIQIGKYKRPGVFLEEIDRSIIESPTIIDTFSTLVVGFSRKGPVNTAVLIQNTSDLERIFGPLDRNLERKGSFFHRTITKLLEQTPVTAVNLLSTSDTEDLLRYRSLSTSTDNTNLVKRTAPYRRFFDTTGFWKRDEQSFGLYTKQNQGDYTKQILGFTNFSDRVITVFVVKSSLTGFDRTMIEWYGTVENMPRYLNMQDYASDYMVDVVVIGGDWTNYVELTSDPRWSQYFTTEGIKKSELRNFANDRNINLLAYYEGLSLVPYFRDSNGRNIFIETVINNDTDRTGLFCTFDNDLFETDYPNGLVDLIGANLVGSSATSVEFLSYKETLVEKLSYSEKFLDSPGNVIGLVGTFSADFRVAPTREERTAFYSDGYINNLTAATISGYTWSFSLMGDTSFNFEYKVSANSFVVIGSSTISLTDNFTYTVSAGTLSNGTYSQVFYLNTSGEFKTLRGSSKPTVAATDIVLGYTTYDIVSGSFSSVTYSNVTVGHSGYRELLHGSSSDYYITATGSDLKTLNVLFPSTTGTIATSDYENYRRIKTFNSLVSFLQSSDKYKGSILLNTDFDKLSLQNTEVQNVVNTQTQNKSFQLVLPQAVTTLMTSGGLILYRVDNELILGVNGFETKTEVAETTDMGSVGEWSTFFRNYYDGFINTGDYFHPNILSGTVSYQFLDSDLDLILFSPTGSVPPEIGIGFSFVLPDSTLNTSVYEIISASGSYYVLDKSVTNETGVANYIWDADTKHYLKMYTSDTSSNENLVCKFTDVTLAGTQSLSNLDYNTNFFPYSKKGNFDQTVDILVPTGWTENPNKILVDSTRYPEIKIGDFLEADYSTASLATGEVPRKLTRILTKRRWSGNTALTELTCDSAIKKTTVNGDYITKRYSSIENYVTTYKGLAFEGFQIREASMPDGTETRQNQILNLVAKGTPLFRALTNKEALDFRYVVDSFGLGLIENSKQQLVDICGERLDAFGIINMPSMRSFRTSVSPSFVDSEGVLQTSFIAEGGDPDTAASFLYSFGQGKGVSAVGYFAPYVTIDDNGRIIDVPPAMYVAGSYLRKIVTTNSTITPWTVVAGVTNGRVLGISDLEIDFSLTDIENLNGAKMNPIVFKRNRGFVIETENTAQTQFVSALSYIHVREVLIELERELADMLLDFQWKFNTPEIRAEIKLRADVICETYVNRAGLYNYFNKCDEENNTPDIIDNQIGVLDTYVEPIKAMGVIVNNVTILRTGAIQSGGFITS